MDIYEHREMARLVEKFLAGTATEAEEEQLHRLYDRWKEAEELVVPDVEHPDTLRAEILQTIHAGIEERTGLRKNVIPLHKTNWWRYAVAASIAVAVCLLSFYYFYSSLKNGPIASNSQKPTVKQSPILPGKDRAILTLADGSTIDVDSADGGLLARQGNTQILSKGGKIIYDPRHSAGPFTGYNTISTPRGGQYQLVLPDGTRVWLNARSSIRFPVAFTGAQRLVEISGEAYLEVAKDPGKPFIARVKNVEVEVLGTSFNLMAYGEEGKIATTLLEGAVRVSKGKEQHIMRPGQQAAWRDNGDFNLNNDADLEEVVAWKNGNFNFNNADIRTIMRQIARWYDVDVEFKDVEPGTRLGGIISRTEDIRQLLHEFEITGKVHFILNGRKITVTP
jgi:transmembrane sensor